jgi:hypothetical protein
MARRDPDKFIADAETAIDSGWRKLPIFRSSRPLALLKLVTAADDKLRITMMSDSRRRAVFSRGLRFSQEGLMTGIPWIFSSCPSSNEPVPQILTTADIEEGVELLTYAEAYDSAIIGFSNYHRHRFRAFVASKERRISFVHASAEIELAEKERKAYEAYQLENEVQSLKPQTANPHPLEALMKIIPNKCSRGLADTIKLEMDRETIAALRLLRNESLRTQIPQIDDSQVLAGFKYRSVRQYYAALGALSQANFGAHFSSAVRNIEGLAASSLVVRMDLGRLNKLISELSDLQLSEIETLTAIFTFDGSLPKMPSICQPLIRANATEVLLPFCYVIGSRFERNFLKLLTRNPATSRQYSVFSSLKESIALPRLELELNKIGIASRMRVPVRRSGRDETDIDILAYDRRDSCLVAIQHKWLIEPDSVNESDSCDEELRRAAQQGQIAKDYLNDPEITKRFRTEFGISGELRIEALVISKGSESTGFLGETEIPIVTEEWFLRNLSHTRALGTLWDLAKNRPDRVQLARTWTTASITAKLVGYEFRIPGFGEEMTD